MEAMEARSRLLMRGKGGRTSACAADVGMVCLYLQTPGSPTLKQDIQTS